MATEAQFLASIRARSDVSDLFGPISPSVAPEGLIQPRRIQIVRAFSNGESATEYVDYGVKPDGQVVENFNRNTLSEDRVDALKDAAETWLETNSPSDWVRYRVSQVVEAESYMILSVLRDTGTTIVDERWLLWRDGGAPQIKPLA